MKKMSWIMGRLAHATGTFYCFVTLKGGFHNLEKDLSIHDKKRC
jgi:hypothetical protein